MVGFDGVLASFVAASGGESGADVANTTTLAINGQNNVHADILDDLWCESTLSEG